MSGELHIWVPGLAAFGGGLTAYNRELVLALGGEDAVRVASKMDADGTWAGRPLRGSGAIPSAGRTAHFAARLVWMALAHRPSLVICGHVNFGPVALVIRRSLGIPFAAIAYGVDIQGLSGLRLRALRAADSVWGISRWTCQSLLGFGIPSSRIRLVPVTVADERFRLGAAPARLRKSLSLGAEEKVVLTVARLDPRERYKGCDRVIRALPSIRQALGHVRYVVVGGGDDIRRLRMQAASLGIEPHVTFTGFVSDADLPDYYRLADVFAMPSSREGFGIVFLEALASGTPTLGGNTDGTRDALADGELGLLVDPTSTDAIADGVVRLLSRRGPGLWFEPHRLRGRCLELYGRAAFRTRVLEALQALERQSTRAR